MKRHALREVCADCGEDQIVVGWDAHHQTPSVTCGCTLNRIAAVVDIGLAIVDDDEVRDLFPPAST